MYFNINVECSLARTLSQFPVTSEILEHFLYYKEFRKGMSFCILKHVEHKYDLLLYTECTKRNLPCLRRSYLRLIYVVHISEVEL